MISVLVLLLLVIAGVYFDLKERRIPNWITMPGLAAGLLLQGFNGGAGGLLTALVGSAAGAALLAIPFALGWLGGGDLKLLAAIGALMGINFTLTTLLFSLAAGCIIAIAWLTVKRSLASSLRYMFLVWLPMPSAKPEALMAPIPFGPAVGLGVFIAMFWR